MLQAVCFIYPWHLQLPDSVRFLKDSYCAKAIPAAALSKLLPPSLLPLPLPGLSMP